MEIPPALSQYHEERRRRRLALEAKLYALFDQGKEPKEIDVKAVKEELGLPSLTRSTVRHYQADWKNLRSQGGEAAKSALGQTGREKRKEARMDDEERERIRREERERAAKEEEEKKYRDKMMLTLDELSSHVTDLRQTMGQFQENVGQLQQAHNEMAKSFDNMKQGVSEEISSVRGEIKPPDLTPLMEEMKSIRELIPADFCERFPQMCTILEKPPSGPAHESAKEYLECPECYPSFAEAVLAHPELRKRIAEALAPEEYETVIQRLKEAGYEVTKLEEARPSGSQF